MITRLLRLAGGVIAMPAATPNAAWWLSAGLIRHAGPGTAIGAWVGIDGFVYFAFRIPTTPSEEPPA